MKNARNVFSFLKDEYGVLLKVLFVIYILSMIYVVRGLPMQLFTAKANEIPATFIASQATKEATNVTEEIVITNIGIEDSIFIPKLGVYAPLTIVESTNPKDFIAPLNKGVTHFPSTLPGETGDTKILGHSSPPGWIDTRYDSVFNKISTLEKGDIIIVMYNNKELKYEVQGNIIVNAGEETPPSPSDTAGLQLISCWPPGIDYQRMVVYSELI